MKYIHPLKEETVIFIEMNSLCGFRLSTVGLIVGWLNLIGSIFSTIVLCVAFARLDDVVKFIEENMDKSGADDAGIRTGK